MNRMILSYGAVSGAVIIASMMGLTGGSDAGASQWFGYLVMILALSVIFLGVKRYRDQELGGVIRFGKAMAVGLGITLVASVVYVATWESIFR